MTIHKSRVKRIYGFKLKHNDHGLSITTKVKGYNSHAEAIHELNQYITFCLDNEDIIISTKLYS